MNQLFCCSGISPESLIPGSAWDIHPFIPDRTPLFQSEESIKRFGLLYVPLVRSLGDGTYEFVTGQRSYFFLKSLSPDPEIYCRILINDLHMSQVLVLLYDEHSRRGPLSPIELAYYVKLCRRLLDKEEQRELYTTLGLSEKPYFISRLLELLELELPLQAGLMQGIISESLARDLLRLHVMDREIVFSLFMQLNLGGGKQKRMLSLLRDLAGRSGISIQKYTGREPFQQILKHPEMNIPQKTQSLLQLMQDEYSPSLNEAENSFKIWQNNLSLPSHCSVQHSEAFEHDSVSLSVNFENTNKLEICWNTIRPYIQKK